MQRLEVATPGGDEVDYDYSGAWAAIVDPTLVDGHAWTYFNTSYHWRRETTITVPATNPGAVISVTGLASNGSELYGGTNISHIQVNQGQNVILPLQ